MKRKRKLFEFHKRDADKLRRQTEYFFEELSFGVYYVTKDITNTLTVHVNAKEVAALIQRRDSKVVISHEDDRIVANFKL